MSDVFGIQAVRAALRDRPERARCLYVQSRRRDARVQELIALAREHQVRYQTVDAAWFKRRVGDEAHQGAVLDCQEMDVQDEAALFAHIDNLAHPAFILILDEITDPRNFGACLRSADGAGVDAVIVPKRNSAPLAGVALKTAQGGAENLFIAEVTNLSRTMKKLGEVGVWITGAAGEAERSYVELDYAGPTALVVGSEDKGMRRLTREHCDQLVHIPMQGRVESLNVSVAASVLLYEVVRQRLSA